VSEQNRKQVVRAVYPRKDTKLGRPTALEALNNKNLLNFP
jgi:hypothetical protein